MTNSSSVWETLSRIDVSQHTEEKNGFTYLSWAWAWSTLKDHYPDAFFEKHDDNPHGLPYVCDPQTGNAFVKVTVEAGGCRATEVFPVLDYKNQAIQNPSAFEVNTALQRGLAKAISYLGLGAYIYAGEDLPPSPKEAEVVDPDGGKETIKGVEMIMTAMTEFLPRMDDVEKLTGFWKKNKQALSVLKSHDPDAYQRLLAEFKQQKRKIEGE